MAYKPILDASQLPGPGPLPEDLRFDMKLVIPTKAEAIEELACDVAAFANAAGGVVLLGAHEHPKDSGKLHAYMPMNHEEAQRIALVLKHSLSLCSPKPIAEAKQLPVPGGFVVAINCDAYAAPPIGVALSRQQGGEKFWAFPTRRGRDTRNLRPEELATIMEPRLRRMTLLLDQIPKLGGNTHRLADFHSTDGTEMQLKIVSVDSEASSVTLGDTQDRRVVIVPLDAVSMIWREPEAPRFHVSLAGRIIVTGRGDYEFRPPAKVR